MSYCNFYIPTNATVIPVDTRETSQKVLLLPAANTVPGKILTIKDQYGTARISSFTISTINNNTIDSYTYNFRFTSSLQSVSLFSDGVNNWRSLYYFSGLNNLQSPFSPSSISSLAIWVDASDPWNRGPLSTVVTTDVPIWYDKSGGQRNLFLSTVDGTMRRVSTSLIGLPSGISTYILQFNKTTYYAGEPRFISAGNTGTTALAVYNGSSEYNFRTGTPTIARIYTQNILYGASGGNTGSFTTPLTTASWVWAPSTQQSFMRFNGSNTGNSFVFNLSTQQGTVFFNLGGSNLGGGQAFRAFGGQYAEFLYFNDALPSSQLQILEGYLAWKWGIQNNLNRNHPYRFVTPSSYDVSSPT